MVATHKAWSGSAWVAKPVKVWNGSAWVAKPIKFWDGSAWIGPASAGPITFADSFDRADANLEASAVASGGWSWTHDGVIAASMVIASNVLRCNTALTTGSAYKTPALASMDHYVQYKVTNISSATGPFACCRLADASNFVGVRTGNGGSNGQIEVYRRVAGSLTSLRTPVASEVAIGDIVRLECSGIYWTLKKNGVGVAGGLIGNTGLTNTGTGLVARSSAVMTLEDFEAGLLTSYADTFDRNPGVSTILENTPVASGGWSWIWDGVLAGALMQDGVNNRLRSNTTDSAGSAYWTPDLGTADHYVQFSVVSTAAVNSGHPFSCCRLIDRNNWVGTRSGSSGIDVFRKVAGVFTQIAGPIVGLAVGDVVRLECSGADFTLKKNGVIIAGPTAIGDASLLLSTRTGVVGRTSLTAAIDNFECGAL